MGICDKPRNLNQRCWNYPTYVYHCFSVKLPRGQVRARPLPPPGTASVCRGETPGSGIETTQKKFNVPLPVFLDIREGFDWFWPFGGWYISEKHWNLELAWFNQQQLAFNPKKNEWDGGVFSTKFGPSKSMSCWLFNCGTLPHDFPLEPGKCWVSCFGPGNSLQIGGFKTSQTDPSPTEIFQLMCRDGKQRKHI